MKSIIALSLGIFLFLGIMYYLFKKRSEKIEKRKQSDEIAKNIGELKETEAKSHLGKRLFFRLKSGLLKR